MKITVYTSRGNVELEEQPLPVSAFVLRIGEVRVNWRAIDDCRFDRCVAEVWSNGRRVESCMVRSLGNVFYRHRATGAVLYSTPEIEAEIQGRLVPGPRSSREVRP